MRPLTFLGSWDQDEEGRHELSSFSLSLLSRKSDDEAVPSWTEIDRSNLEVILEHRLR